MDKLPDLNPLRDILDAAHNGIVIIDTFGIIMVYNKAARSMLNKDRDDLLGEFIGHVYPNAWDELRQILRDGIPQIGAKITLGESTIIANRTPIRRNGGVIGIISVFQDISAYENIAHDLESYKKVNKELHAIINSSFDGLWVCDKKGRVVHINRASEKINNISREQIIGKRMEMLIQEGLIDRSVTLEVLKNQAGVTIIQNLKDGKRILVTGNPVFDDKGEVELVVVNERDITNLNKLRNELEESRALASRYRSELSLKTKEQDLLSETVLQDEAMKRVFNRAIKVAQVDSTVLIQGETGVGKGFFARLIHRASPRKDGPFIRVDCGAIPETLIESELFGYEKGAFTGARTEGKPGLFELAQGGTLFLDEIGDLPLSVQVKLLRFLEENTIMRVGDTKTRKIDARVIAATHRNLEKMAKTEDFRQDLLFRLNVIPIKIPSLRERGEDIPALINFFLTKFNRKHSMDKIISPRAIDCLCGYHYPGNIRELSNLIERIVVLAQNRQVDFEDLPAHLHQITRDFDILPEENELNLSEAVVRIEKDLIMRSLKKCGSQRKAARLLGINQSTLARKAKRYGISSDAILHYDA
ncbi:MAG: sigma 54-interacting transcriptional regulator [Desulfobacteraceae bacterium]